MIALGMSMRLLRLRRCQGIPTGFLQAKTPSEAMRETSHNLWLSSAPFGVSAKGLGMIGGKPGWRGISSGVGRDWIGGDALIVFGGMQSWQRRDHGQPHGSTVELLLIPTHPTLLDSARATTQPGLTIACPLSGFFTHIIATTFLPLSVSSH
jgi:hypothetical protein